MKRLLFLTTVGIVLLAASCKVHEYKINRNMLPIEFKPLSNEDFTIQRGLTAEITLTGRLTKYGRVYDLKRTDKRMYIYSIVPDMLTPYFVGNLNTESSVEVPLYSQNVVVGKFFTFFEFGNQNLINKAKYSTRILPHHFAFVALVEKYPDIDYFTNVRFDSKFTTNVLTKEFTEVVKITADGIELRTDN